MEVPGLVGVSISRAGEGSRMPEDGWGTNGVLAVAQTEARFFCKDGWKEIDPDIWSINRLCWVNQLYPKTKEQEKSSGMI